MRTATLTLCGIALLTASPASEVHPATWTPLAHKPSVNSIGTMVLLTDGSVMMESYDDIQTWIKLTPDAKRQLCERHLVNAGQDADTPVVFRFAGNAKREALGDGW